MGIAQAEHDDRHVIVVHQWEDHYADYESYFDHSAGPVSYIVTPVGSGSVPSTAARVVTVEKTSDLAVMRETVADLADRFGRPRGIVALKENVLPVVTALRAEFGAAGRRAEDLHHFLYKDTMIAKAREIGVPIPETADVANHGDLTAFAAEHGWPVVIKPTRGSASEGVRLLHSPADVESVVFDRPMLVQAFVPHPIIVVDGVWLGDRHGPWRMSRYLENCLSFRHGTPLGFVEIDDAAVNAAMGEFLDKLLPGLCAEPYVYHLEAFMVPGEVPSFVFLEIGSRVGGAETPFLWREVHGFDLMAVECQLQLGIEPADLPTPELSTEDVAGYLLMPAPSRRPCRVVAAKSMLGPGGPYAEKVLTPGGVIPRSEAYYEHVGGRFRFRGATTAGVEASITKVAAEFELETVPFDGTDA
ncbi:Carbamoyl-phosphate synthase L chain, ATP binding domain [Actinokineospora alba]|uniref:Carbamoyl-phosphate synthase L chain, ATP binding domain n=1 Tax=Actinokineospora alba TaxID=504798 RepID=A0A1H0NIU3_9PSEU|nr:biotin carboxylase [Actinokineospora alba]TDP68738.1 carbamoyl-phosphate synthase L subunit-like protein [Actinokineospora alba]SDH85551.1 Carbamoyl-phosphate synthase L chain, ATP binding domain [Actinokineospora alba]SDO92682.1 Carbamoyl-phosphate synthase L chain, ATP binding domain [Actinokineospora alba]